MDKNNKKTKYDPFRASIIKDIMSETGYSQTFVREAIKGQRKSLAGEEVRRQFNTRYTKLKEVLRSHRL